MTAPRYLLNADGECFDDLETVLLALEQLDSAARTQYRNDNASSIASVDIERVLIVAGPGSGKSHLFISRIEHWFANGTEHSVYVSTFVRKLVKDLQTEVERLPAEQQEQVQVSTLHTLARSILSRSCGSADHPMNRFIRVIAEPWDEVTWQDVLAFHPELDDDYPLETMEDQFHRGIEAPDTEWEELRATYRRLCSFYNAAGFAYMIVFAHEALVEKPELNGHQLWIIDEYQDFNPSEDSLIRELTEDAAGVLLAGDDEQALYQTLKASSPDIIIGHYNDESFANAMLPFCSRCSFHICRAASMFIARHRSESAIDKIYLPLEVELEDVPKVQVVGTAAPAGAVDYVRKFMEDHDADYQEYLKARQAGTDSDPFLLILSQGGGLTMSRSSKADLELFEFVDAHAGDSASRSASYVRVVAYYTAGAHPSDNFSLRKVLDYERLSIQEVHELIAEAMERAVTLSTVVEERHPDISARILQVLALVDTAQADPVDAATELAALLKLKKAGILAEELAEFPINKGSAAQEDEEAIETAGLVAPVALLTMIGSKGLSAHHVIVLGCDEMNMGYTSPLTFFVALTRARTSLHLVTSAKTGGSKAPHQFIYDLPEDCCDYLCYKKTGRVIDEMDGADALTKWFEKLAKGQAWGRKKAAAKKRGKQG